MKFTQPIKLVMGGNEAACHHYIRYAAKQLGILEKQMAFQGINDSKRTVSPIHGVVVHCISRFNYREMQIYVQPRPAEMPQERKKEYGEKQEKEQLPECSQYLFYVRIECEGSGGAPPTDRLILYRMFFNGLPADTPLTDASNASKGFTPGTGEVIADVDLLESLLIYPAGLADEEALSLVNLAATLSGNIPSIGAESVGPKNHFSDRYEAGPMENLLQAAVAGGYGGDIPSTPLSSIYLSQGLDVSGGVTWWFFMDQTDAFDDLEIWRNKWSPIYGGDTRLYLDGYPWGDLEEVAPYYNKFAIPGSSEDPEPVEEYTYSKDVYNDGNDFNGSSWYNDATAKYRVEALNASRSEDELVGGFFFTSPIVNGAPSFFLAKTGIPKDTLKWVRVVGTVDDWVNELGLFTDPFIKADFHEAALTSVITPLEEVGFSDFLSVREVPCSEMEGTYWATAPSVTLQLMYPYSSIEFYKVDNYAKSKIVEHWGLPYNLLAAPLVAQEYPEYEGDEIYGRYCGLNSNPTIEGMDVVDCFFLDDPPQELDSCQTKFCSFTYINETVVSGTSALVNNYSNDFHTYCNGVRLDGGTKVASASNLFGCIIYIFAPRALYGEDDIGNKTYWDIHTARVSEDVINPFRCLALEEYLLTVIENIKGVLDNDPGTDKLITDPPTAHSLDYYGYNMRTGFVREG